MLKHIYIGQKKYITVIFNMCRKKSEVFANIIAHLQISVSLTQFMAPLN